MQTTTSAKVVILFGGTSGERLVSVASAQDVFRALPHAACWFWTPDDRLHIINGQDLLAHTDPFMKAFDPAPLKRFDNVPKALDAEDVADAVFVLSIHGLGGEDGLLQGWLEERRLFFTGSSAQVCRDTFDKVYTKQKLAAQGFLVAQEIVISAHEPDKSLKAMREMFAQAGRLVVKPRADGSSVGLCFVNDEAQLMKAYEAVMQDEGREFLVEPFIEGVELTAGVIEDEEGGLRALPCTEIAKEKDAHFDYMGKYLGRGIDEITPARVGESVSRAAQQMALSAHRLMGCKGYSRTDTIMTPQGPLFLEINTLPGLTKVSLLPKQLVAAGIKQVDFWQTQIAIAKKRYTP